MKDLYATLLTQLIKQEEPSASAADTKRIDPSAQFQTVLKVFDPPEINLHRKELSASGSAYEFLCQTSSVDFLAKHQFNFNVLHEGLSNHDATNSEATEDWADNIDPDNLTYEVRLYTW